jgi:hypothetical protein
MIQQGQVFKLQASCANGEPLWAYRYRVAGRGSARLQVGRFSSKAEAQRALKEEGHPITSDLGPDTLPGSLPNARYLGRF